MNEQSPDIPDRSSGMVARARLQALAQRVGPSFHTLRRRPWFAWIVIFLILVGGAFLTFFWVVEALIHAKSEVIVPDLTGKTVDEALDILSPFKLSLAKDAVEYNESFPPGTVLKQSPPPQLQVREGKVIRVTLSSGGQVVFIPDLTNKPLPEAQNQLRAQGLLLGALAEAYSQRYESGWVMEQTPSSGTVVNRGEMVDLRVSKGPPPQGTLLMPDFVNRPLSQATEWLQQRGVRPSVEEEIRPDMLPGLILRQSPIPDTLIGQGTAVSFTVSKSTVTLSNAQIVRYDIPAGSDRVQVRIVVRDDKGEREVFQAYQDPGSAVEVPVVVRGPSRARIFVNGVLIEERMLE
jgi:eukaryotic-like serine/threonine-protein kinase